MAQSIPISDIYTANRLSKLSMVSIGMYTYWGGEGGAGHHNGFLHSHAPGLVLCKVLSGTGMGIICLPIFQAIIRHNFR